MKICKYCKKPISDEPVWNPDGEGNGYHHECLCEMQFISRDRQIYNKGRTDVLDKIRAEFISLYPMNYAGEPELGGSCCVFSLNKVLKIIDKYKAESEDKDE